MRRVISEIQVQVPYKYKYTMFSKNTPNLFNAFRRYCSRNIIKLKERKMLEDIFPDISVKEVTDLLNASPQTVYAGFDPTADSLHVGNLLVLSNLLHWQRGGHNVIALIGGATAKIGDPSGKSVEREELSYVFVDDNISGIRENIETVFNNHKRFLVKNENRNLAPIKILNNESWYKTMTPIELIGKIGRHLRMGNLLSRTSVQTRLNSSVGMSFTEFSYQLFQAYDWLHLFRQYGCRFQIGGNDQMGNIMSGYDLISRVCKKQVYGITVPIVTTEMGDKFGKSAGNAIWLSPKKTSPFSFYQFWMRIPDSHCERMLKLFTFDTVGAITDLMQQHDQKPELRLPQKRLAEQVTLLVHGEDGLEKARLATEALYGSSVNAISGLTAEEIANVFNGAEIVELLPEAGQTVFDLAMKARCFVSDRDALRIISAGGFYINQKKTTNPAEVLSPIVHVLKNNVTLLRVGKRNYYIIKWLS